MCGRIVTIIPADELKKIFDLIERPQTEPRYNVAPSQQIGVVRQSEGSAGNRFDYLKWGLIPTWSKDAKIASHTINARSETIAEKPSFRHAIKKQRCIVPVSGFYEWAHTGKEKEPHYIYLKDGSPMCFAGIWENWITPEGSPLETFSIVTTEANDLIKPLHDRMPVILPPESFGMWLDRGLQDPHHLEHLYTPYPDEALTFHKVPALVNSPRFDSPACIVRV